MEEARPNTVDASVSEEGIEVLELEDMYSVSDATVQVADSHVVCEGESVHKASVVWIVFSSDRSSADRLKMVRGFIMACTLVRTQITFFMYS